MSTETFTHSKDVCKKCWQFHERAWGAVEDEDWKVNHVSCPTDYFSKVRRPNDEIVELPKRLRNFFSMVFGWHETTESLPPWCSFKGEHQKSLKGFE